MIGVELEYFLEVGGAPHDSHPYPILVFFSPFSISLLDDLICLKHHPSLSKCLITNLAACPLRDTYTDPISLQWDSNLPSMSFLNTSINLNFRDLTTLVLSYKLHTGPIKKIPKWLTTNAAFATSAHLPSICPVCCECVKFAAAVTSVEYMFDYDKLFFLLLDRTTVRERIQSSVVCLMVMDLMAIWLLRE